MAERTKITLRFWIVAALAAAAGRHVLPLLTPACSSEGADVRAEAPTMTVPADPIDLERLSLDSFAGRRVAVLGLARSGIALARFLGDRGARVTVYDVRPESELGDAIAALGGRPVRLLAGPSVDPSEALDGQALVGLLALHQQPLPDDRAPPPGGSGGARERRPRAPWSGRSTCSCGSARLPPSA